MKVLYHLFTGKPFEFYTNYTLDEANEKLELLSERDYRHPSRWQISSQLWWINIEPADDGKQLKFNGERNIMGRLKVMVNGVVISDNSGLGISGEICVAKDIILLIFPFLILSILMSFAEIMLLIRIGNPFDITAILPLAFMILFLLPCIYAQNEFYEKIHLVFGKSKKKKKMHEGTLSSTK